ATRVCDVRKVNAAACGVALALLAGCAGSLQDLESETLLPEIDVVQVKENSDEALKLAQEAKLDVEVLNNKLTEIDNKLILLSEEISGVSIAKLEEIENRMALLIEAYKDLQAQISALEVLPRVRVKKKATFSPSSASGVLKTSSEYDSYHNALRVFNSRNYPQAIKLFTETLGRYKTGTYADNCQYWIGECHYALGDYASAIAAFKEVFSFARTSKADDAQLKMGLSYLKMGQYGTAKAELQKLIDRYPASEYVPRARKYLTEMK
ncbi:unnamed protein product, partial [marine sediment metagenome]